MERDYTLERSRIKSELLNKENELLLFEKELNEIQDPATQAKQIEEKLFSHYAQIYKIHPIDRSIEKEIKDTIDNKRTNVTKTVREMNDSINQYNGYYPNISTLADLQNNEKKVKKECANELKKIFGELEIDIKRFYKSGIAKDNLEKIIAIMKDICDEISDIATLPVSYQSKVYKWELVAKELPDDEEKENQRKEKSFMEKQKKSLRDCRLSIDDISKEIRKLKKSIKNDEATLAEQTSLLETIERNYDTNKTCIHNDYKIKKNDLILLYNNKANELKKRFGIEKRSADQAITDANSRILTCLENIDRIRVESKGNIQKAFFIKKERHDTSIANLNKLISVTQKELEQLKKEKTQLEKEINGVFVLSIKKKQALKDKLNENAHIITQTAEKLATYQKQLTPLLNEDPEADMKVVLRMLDEMYENVRSVSNGKIIETPIIGNRNVNSLLFDFANSIKPIQQEFILLNIRLNEIKKMNYDTAMDSAMHELKHSFESEEDKIKKEAIEKQEKLDNELETARCSIENTINEITELKKKLEEKSVSLKDKNSLLPSLQEQLDNSHTLFLIHNFSDMINIKEKVKNKKAQIKKVSSEIRTLNKELQIVEKAIANAEKELVKKAEIDRKLKIQQEEREQRIHKELKDREKELSLISSKKKLLRNIPDVVRQLEADSSNALLSVNSCPLKDDGKRIITNGIVRKSYSQKNSDYDCDQYLLLFVDSCGNPISDQRLIQKKKVGETTNTSFELSSPDGFNSQNYYLIMLDFDTGSIISVQRYKINIAFANEFNF